MRPGLPPGLPEVPLPAGTLMIGDLHLDVEQAGADVERFCRFLEQRAPPRLVILGDLFEYWIGQAQERAAGRVLDALARRVAAGCAIDVVPGNRDFLLDARFEARSGAVLRPEGLVGLLERGAGRVLVLHGDVLCSADRAYQRLRRVLRSGALRWLARRAPAALGVAVARRLRGASRRAVSAKAAFVTALQPDACRTLAARHRCDTLVCGHAHRFRDEALAGGPRLIVVDAFGGERDTLVVGPGGSLAPAAGELLP